MAARTSDPAALVRRTAAEWMDGVRDLTDPEALAARVDPIAFGGAIAEAARAVISQPLPAARTIVGLATGSGRAAVAAVLRGLGAHDDGPASLPEKDRRYADPAWEGNPYYFLVRQQHALFAEHLRALSAEIELSPTSRRKIDFLVQQAIEATAPVNWPWSNPAVLKKALETGGRTCGAPATPCRTPSPPAACPARRPRGSSWSGRTWRRRRVRWCTATG